MKISKWVIIEENGEDLTLVNSLNKCVLKTKKVFFYQMVEDPNIIPNAFLENKFFVEDSFDDNKYLNYYLKNKQYCSTNLGLSIIPNYSCNLKCEYCFGKYDYCRGNTNYKNVHNIIDWVGQLQEIFPRRDVSIVYTGGEPLLQKELFIELASGIKNACKKSKSLTQSIITNGTLLDDELFNFLKVTGFTSIQITLDGPKNIHNKKRFYTTGEGTFDQIFENIKKVVNYVPNVYLRINIDNENYQTIPELLDLLEKNNLKKKVILNPARIIEVDKDSELSNQEKRKSEYETEAVDYLIEIFDEIKKRGFQLDNSINNVCRAISPCMFHSENSFLVDGLGDVYKCNMLIGDKKYSIGNILQSENIFNLDYIKASNSLTKIHSFCGDCEYLPICNGGCRYKVILNGKEMYDVYCEKESIKKISSSRYHFL